MFGFILLQTTTNTAETFEKFDPWGIAMAVIAMGVVFIALILLYVSFKYIGFAFTTRWKLKALIKQGKLDEVQHIENSSTGELNAAIGLALYMYKSELQDMESINLTINKVSRNYSPWSSKIYGLRNIQNKNW
jgi:Na+-transporting methylmalonyl-CoA/oxaloacetate decarboxylase gamma subunit